MDLLLEDKKKNRSKISKLEAQLHKLEQEIDNLNKRLEKLHAKWNKISYDRKPILEHTYYIEKYYHVSPWDVRHRNGCLYHSFEDFYCRDLRPYFPKNEDNETIEERKKRLEDKRKHIQRYKNRQMNEVLQPENKASKNRDDSSDWVEEPSDGATQIEPLDDEHKKEHINRYKNRKKLIECEENCEDEETKKGGKGKYKR